MADGRIPEEERGQFMDRMLGATFDFARLGLANGILINGGASVALMAFLGTSAASAKKDLRFALLVFSVCTGVGGVASLLAYVGQRIDWERHAYRHQGETAAREQRRANRILGLAFLCGLATYVGFMLGCAIAGSALFP